MASSSRVPSSTVPDPDVDANQIWEAIKYDNQIRIINIFVNGNPGYGLDIVDAFETRHRKLDFFKALETIMRGQMIRAIKMWTFSLPYRDCYLSFECISHIKDGGFRVKRWRDMATRTFVEIFCSRTPDVLTIVRRGNDAVCGNFMSELQKHTIDADNGHIRKFLLKLVSTKRDIGNEVNKPLAIQDANVLYEKFRQKIYNDDEVIEIFLTRSKSQMQETNDEYHKLSESDIEFDLSIYSTGNMSVDNYEICLLLLNTISCLLYPKSYYFNLLNKAIENDDNDTLTRVVLTRIEIDLQQIKEMYELLNDRKLKDDIGRDTYHRRMLYKLLVKYNIV